MPPGRGNPRVGMSLVSLGLSERRYPVSTVAIYLATTMTSSNGNSFRVTGTLWRETTGHRWFPFTKSQLRGALMFSLISAWTNGWASNGDAGVLKRHRAHYGVTVIAWPNLVLQGCPPHIPWLWSVVMFHTTAGQKSSNRFVIFLILLIIL